MVTTRSQSVSPRKRSVPANYYNADMEDEGTPTPVSPRKRAVSARATTASPTKSKTPRRRKSMAPVIVKDEIVVKTEDEPAGEHMNGHAVEKRPKTPRKVSGRVPSGEVKPKGKASHKVDNSGKFEFGGTPGTLAMMTFFPILMYYLWICSTFYGGSVLVKKGSETWLAFADRMVAHILKVMYVSDVAYNREHILRSMHGSSTGRLSLLRESSMSPFLESKSKAIHCETTIIVVFHTTATHSGRFTLPSRLLWASTSLDYSN